MSEIEKVRILSLVPYGKWPIYNFQCNFPMENLQILGWEGADVLVPGGQRGIFYSLNFR